MSALGRNLLRLAYGLPPDPADADELGRIFDATPLYGVGEPDHCEACPFAGCSGCRWQGGNARKRPAMGSVSDSQRSGVVLGAGGDEKP